MARESCYITTPIYYVNSVPHIGTAYTTIAADALARYRRMTGHDTLFLTGLDEHGQKVEQAAQANGMSPQEWCDTMAASFKQTWEMLNISNDRFIRTTDPEHERAVQVMAQKLYDSGDIYKGTYEGWYCVPDETYWASSDIPDDHSCPDCGRGLTYVEEENYFFRLSKYQQPLLDFYEANPQFVGPDIRRNEVLSFVNGGLRDLSISRANVKWGVPLPWDPNHTVYVWFDALINYATAVGYGDPERAVEFAYRWPAQTHFVGKDIIRFHCVIWPAMLMAAGEALPDRVFAHGFLLAKGEKMSKSKGNAVSPAQLVERFGVDGFRYYFMRDVNFGSDGSISDEAMVQRYNGDLANDWGNLCSRLFNMIGKYCDGRVPSPGLQGSPAGYRDAQELREIAVALPAEFEQRMAALDYAGALEAAWSLIKATNRYIEESAPWSLAKSEDGKAQLDAVMYHAAEAIRIAALFTAPVMPDTSAEVWRRLSLEDIGTVTDIAGAAVWGGLPVGNAVEKGEALFPRIVEIDATAGTAGA